MITAAALSDIGRTRSVNQDTVFSSVDRIGAFPNLFIIADGMGGHKGGGFASSFLVDTVRDYISKTRCEDISRVIGNSVELANSMLQEHSHRKEELRGMGSTFVSAVISGNLLTAANIGDSRLYLIRDTIRQITKDHSYVEEMVERGLMERGSADYRQKKHLITRAVGIEDNIKADYFDVELRDGDYVLLCSDGLTNMIPDEDIFQIVTGLGNLGYKTRALIELANNNGGYDNIAVILIKYKAEGETYA